MNIAAAVIVYNPPGDVAYNIGSYSSGVSRVYIFDNSEEKSRELMSLPNTTYFNDGQNKGIAARLNEACRVAILGGFDWLLTMDQDSYFSPGELSYYKGRIESMKDKDKVSMTGVKYDGNRKETGPAEVEQLITSGSAINLSVFEELGGFDEALFIDEVDLDYCYKSLVRGFKIIQFNDVFLTHSLGTTSYHKSFKSFKTTPRVLHSPLRLYYMVRNFLYVNGKYKGRFKLSKKVRGGALLNRLKNNLLYGQQRGLLIKMISEAVIDYSKNRMGKKA